MGGASLEPLATLETAGHSGTRCDGATGASALTRKAVALVSAYLGATGRDPLLASALQALTRKIVLRAHLSRGGAAESRVKRGA